MKKEVEILLKRADAFVKDAVEDLKRGTSTLQCLTWSRHASSF
jgi:HEPN domain-containing protein